MDLLNKLQKLVTQHGHAQVTVWYGLSSTNSIYGWLKNKKIPSDKIKLTEIVLKKHGKKNNA